MTDTLTPDTRNYYGRPFTTKERAEDDAYKAAWADLTATLGRTPTPADEAYWQLPKYTSGANDPELAGVYAQERALAEGREYTPAEAPEAPQEAPKPAPAPKAPATPPRAAAAPDADGIIYVPNKVCRDCDARIERKAGPGRPPAKCLACRAKDAEAAAAKAAR